MSKARLIVSATVEGTTVHGNVEKHCGLLMRFLSPTTKHKLAHAVGMFEGKEELSIVVDMENVPFIVLAATAHDLAKKFGQKSVYFSREGKAYLATYEGDMVHLGKECEGVLTVVKMMDVQDFTRIVGTDFYIWTTK